MLEEYEEAVKRDRFMRDMIPNLVANVKMIVALAAAAQVARQHSLNDKAMAMHYIGELRAHLSGTGNGRPGWSIILGDVERHVRAT